MVIGDKMIANTSEAPFVWLEYECTSGESAIAGRSTSYPLTTTSSGEGRNKNSDMITLGIICLYLIVQASKTKFI